MWGSPQARGNSFIRAWALHHKPEPEELEAYPMFAILIPREDVILPTLCSLLKEAGESRVNQQQMDL